LPLPVPGERGQYKGKTSLPGKRWVPYGKRKEAAGRERGKGPGGKKGAGLSRKNRKSLGLRRRQFSMSTKKVSS